MKETQLNKKVADWINKLPSAYAYKRLGGVANKGQPDVTGCIQGYRIELEGKMPGKKPTPLQAQRLRLWADAGAITGVYYSLEEAQKIVASGLLQRKIIVNLESI